MTIIGRNINPLAKIGAVGHEDADNVEVSVVVTNSRPSREEAADALLQTYGFTHDDLAAYDEEQGTDLRARLINELTKDLTRTGGTYGALRANPGGQYQGTITLPATLHTQLTEFIASRRAPAQSVPFEGSQTAKGQQLRFDGDVRRWQIERQMPTPRRPALDLTAVPEHLEQVGYGSTNLSRFAIEHRRANNIPLSRNVAVFEYVDQNNVLVKLAKESGRAQGHAERLIWKELEGQGITPEQVRGIYSELEPCVTVGGYCKPWIARTFPGAAVSYSFEYGLSEESRASGREQLRQAAVQL